MNRKINELPEGHVQRIFRAMLTARILEDKLRSLYRAGKIVGGVYLGKGQEAVSASLGVCLEMGKDVYAPLIRDQAGRTAFGEDILDCTRAYLGSVEGPMRGRDGNIHRGIPQKGMIAMISHLGASIAVINGMLLAKRIRGTMDGVVGAASIGDGCTSTGAFHEALNVAAVEKLPLVLVVANNHYAYSTPNEKEYACSRLVDKALGYGVKGYEVDGTDLLACSKVMWEAVQRARSGEGPQLVVAEMLRLTGHGEHDDGFYVDEKLKNSAVGRDCMEVGEAQMLSSGLATSEELASWRAEVEKEVQEAVAQTQKEAEPDPHLDDWQVYSFSRSSFFQRPVEGGACDETQTILYKK